MFTTHCKGISVNWHHVTLSRHDEDRKEERRKNRGDARYRIVSCEGERVRAFAHIMQGQLCIHPRGIANKIKTLKLTFVHYSFQTCVQHFVAGRIKKLNKKSKRCHRFRTDVPSEHIIFSFSPSDCIKNRWQRASQKVKPKRLHPPPVIWCYKKVLQYGDWQLGPDELGGCTGGNLKWQLKHSAELCRPWLQMTSPAHIWDILAISFFWRTKRTCCLPLFKSMVSSYLQTSPGQCLY